MGIFHWGEAGEGRKIKVIIASEESLGQLLKSRKQKSRKTKMSYVDKKFCFNCKLDADQLVKQKQKLSTCSGCNIAQYCGRACQRIHYLYHKMICVDVYKRQKDLAAKAKKILEDNGHDVTGPSSLKEFYAKNDPVFQCVKKANNAYIYAGAFNILHP